MSGLPRTTAFDSTLALIREGYGFIPSRCEKLGSDLFETRIMLRRVICMSGEGAAELFYGSDRFTRRGAMPITVLKLLQDFGSVQLLDDKEHRHRKQMFMSLMDADSVAELTGLAEQRFLRSDAIGSGTSIVLFDHAREVLLRAACAWAGVELDEGEVRARTTEISEMIEASGRLGPRNWRAMILRRRSERWARAMIRRIRAEPGTMDRPRAAQMIAHHLDMDGNSLDEQTAAIELLNVLRPTVAVARFIVYTAVALHQHPEKAQQLREGSDEDFTHFVEEVRRLSPFFPFVGGRVREAFEWRGRLFKKGDWVLLDLYGTNRDARSWRAPLEFRPERFAEGQANPFNFIPQGGADPSEGHRCPGERITVELMKMSARVLLRRIRFEVPEQDLSIDLAKIPALPRSGFVMRDVRPA